MKTKIEASAGNQAQATPGPWQTCRNPGYTGTIYGTSICGPTGFDQPTIANVVIPGVVNGPAISEANARLIAAAPELLAALKDQAKALREAMDRLDAARMGYIAVTFTGAHEAARNAIAKAEGRS